MSAAAIAVEVIVAGLLILRGLFVLVSAVGFARLPDFFLRLHPPALAFTLGSWCVALAAALYFSFLEKRAALDPMLIPLLLAITVPVTTVLLARVPFPQSDVRRWQCPADAGSVRRAGIGSGTRQKMSCAGRSARFRAHPPPVMHLG
jgi:multicomponent K+:H+ antiporter subunit G